MEQQPVNNMPSFTENSFQPASEVSPSKQHKEDENAHVEQVHHSEAPKAAEEQIPSLPFEAADFASISAAINVALGHPEEKQEEVPVSSGNAEQPPVQYSFSEYGAQSSGIFQSPSVEEVKEDRKVEEAPKTPQKSTEHKESTPVKPESTPVKHVEHKEEATPKKVETPSKPVEHKEATPQKPVELKEATPKKPVEATPKKEESKVEQKEEEESKQEEKSEPSVPSTPKQPRSSRGSSAPTSTLSTPRSSGRIRKAVERFSPAQSTPGGAAAIEIPAAGPGSKLEDIPFVAHSIANQKAAAKIPILLHRILYGRQGEVSKRKANLRAFHGFDPSKDRDQLKDKLATNTVKDLKAMVSFLGLEPTGDKEIMATRITDFLMHPKDSGRIPGGLTKRSTLKKSASSPKKARTVGEAEEDIEEEDEEEVDEEDIEEEEVNQEEIDQVEQNKDSEEKSEPKEEAQAAQVESAACPMETSA